MKYLGVIPARLGSTRLERKPLQPLNGKPLILWVCEAVKKSQLLDKFVVATDSKDVFECVTQAGFEAQMTSESCASGTDRALEVALKIKPEFIINIQGDEPLIKANEIDDLCEFIQSKEQDCWVTLAHDLSSEDLVNPNAVKVVLNKNNRALYFSRFGIPYSKEEFKPEESTVVLKHVGLYGYTLGALNAFCQSERSELERAESLEQLRALYIDTPIFVKKTKYRSIGVDTIEDLKRVELILKDEGNK